MASTFLTSTGEDARTALGAFGRPVISYYPQLQAYVAERLGPEIAGYFAEPMREPGQPRTDWFTDGDGPATPLSALSGAERRAMQDILRNRRDALSALATEDPPDGAAEIHRILSMALAAPADEDVFVVDGAPVVTNWGFEAPPPPLANNAPDNMPEATGSATLPADQPPRSRPDVHTLCMLAALAVTGVAGALNGLGLFGDRPNFAAAQTVPDTRTAVADLRALQARNDRLRTDIDTLQEDFLSRALACLDQCAAPASPVAPTPPPPTPDAPPTPEAPPGEALTVPDGAAENDDLAFLEGTWRSTSDGLRLTFTDSDRPDETITVEYNLNTDGEGTRTVTMQDGTICTGTVAASFDADAQLVITETDPAECGGGLQVIAYRVTCAVDAAGLAKCAMRPRNRPDAASVATELRRLP